MKIRVVSFQDIDVSEGLRALMKKSPPTEVLASVAGPKFVESVGTVCDEFDLVAMFVPDPLKDISQEDVLAFVWDDSEEVNRAYLSVEDFGLQTWDLSDGLSGIEAVPDDEDLEAVLVSNFLELMDTMVDYITENVLTMVEHTLYHMGEDGEDDDDEE